MAAEKVTLYGLPIVAARQVNYGSVDPAAARDLFIQHALVEGDWQTHHAFFARNQRAREEAEELEHKARRRGLVADDGAVFAFYDQRIPKTVTSARHFDSWWKKARARRARPARSHGGRPGRPGRRRDQPGGLPGALGRVPAVL